MSAYEPEIEEALKKYSLSSYAKLNPYFRSTKVLETESGTDYSARTMFPFVVRDPAGGDPHFFFTGRDAAGDSHVFKGRIDPDYEVSGVGKLIESGYPNADWDWTDSVSVKYDDENENWIVIACGHYAGTGDDRAAFFRFSEDFSTVLNEQAPLQVGGADIGFATSKVSLLRFGGGQMVGLCETYMAYNGIRTNDYTADLPTWTEQDPQPAVRATTGANLEEGAALVTGKDQAVVLVPMHRDSGNFAVHPVFVTHDPSSGEALGGIGRNPVLGRLDPSGVRGNSLRLGCLTHLPDLIGYNLFFNPDVDEIRVLKVPEERLTMAYQDLVTYTPWHSEGISGGDSTFPLPGQGRKTIKFTSDTAGTLTVEVRDSIGWMTLDTFTNTTEEIQMTEYSADHMRLSFDTAATVSAAVSVEPGV